MANYADRACLRSRPVRLQSELDSFRPDLSKSVVPDVDVRPFVPDTNRIQLPADSVAITFPKGRPGAHVMEVEMLEARGP